MLYLFPEEGTGASNMPDTLTIEEKNSRLDEIMSIQADISKKKT